MLQEKDYRLRDTKQGGCNDKAAEMGLTAAELRRRIKTLKDIAVKALKPPPSGAGGRICTPQQQRCVELFGFLAKKVVRRPGRTTLKVSNHLGTEINFVLHFSLISICKSILLNILLGEGKNQLFF